MCWLLPKVGYNQTFVKIEGWSYKKLGTWKGNLIKQIYALI